MRGLQFFLILVGAMLASLGATAGRAQEIDPRWGVLAELAGNDFPIVAKLVSPGSYVMSYRWESPTRIVERTWQPHESHKDVVVATYEMDPQTGAIVYRQGKYSANVSVLSDGTADMTYNGMNYRVFLRKIGPGRFEQSGGKMSGSTFKPHEPSQLFPMSEARPITSDAAAKRAERYPLQPRSAGALAEAASVRVPPVSIAQANPSKMIAPSISTPTVIFRPNAPRIALIIGNSDYGVTFGSLPNPGNDADAMATALTALGFQVELIKDVDQKNMKRAIARFGARLRQAGRSATGLFFYAGHGLQTGGINYLVPVNSAIEAEADVDLESVAADTVLRQMEEAGSATNIVILDACRNMPLARSLRSGTRGLARMDAPNGSFVAYSTAPGSVAVDGTGRNSPFVIALVKAMQQKGQPIETIFRTVRRSVLHETGGRQTPWDSSSLIDPFYFAGE